jgi:flagellar assembly protein FliH
MKYFRPYHFPSLSQVKASQVVRADAGAPGLGAGQDWQGAAAEGFNQGQREGYEAGFDQGRADGYAAGQAEGHAAGVAQGLELGRAQAMAQFDAAAKPVETMMRALRKLRADLRHAQRTEVVDLVGKIARQVIRAELALQPVQILALVDEALAAMPPTRDAVEVFLNPEELRRVTELDPKRARKWNLMADAALEPGECRVRAGDQEVDAGCQGRLAACMEQVSEQLSSAERGEEAAA